MQENFFRSLDFVEATARHHFSEYPVLQSTWAVKALVDENCLKKRRLYKR
jgi:hypothetical protein